MNRFNYIHQPNASPRSLGTDLHECFGTADDFLDRYAALPSAARNSAGVRPPSASLRLSVL